MQRGIFSFEYSFLSRWAVAALLLFVLSLMVSSAAWAQEAGDLNAEEAVPEKVDLPEDGDVLVDERPQVDAVPVSSEKDEVVVEDDFSAVEAAEGEDTPAAADQEEANSSEGQSGEVGDVTSSVEIPAANNGKHSEQTSSIPDVGACGNEGDSADDVEGQSNLPFDAPELTPTCPSSDVTSETSRALSNAESGLGKQQNQLGATANTEATPSPDTADARSTATASSLQTAQTSDTASGTWGTCSWNISSSGVLTVNPGTGVDYGEYPNSYPWSAYKSSITSVVFAKSGTSKVKLPANSRYMFYLLENATSIDLSGADTSSVTDMKGMFYNCANLTMLSISSFNTARVENMANMFYCPSLQNLNLSSFNTSSVTDMAGMFGGCKALVTLTLPSTFSTVSVQDMSGMFLNCALLASIDVSGFNTVGVRNMKQMFSGCTSLEALDLSSFKTSNVSNMESMFYGCSTLKSLDLSSFNTSYVNTMKSMFGSCNSLTAIDLSSFNTVSVTDMSYMFAECDSLASLDLSGFNTASVTDMSIMFMYCSSLKSLDLSSFNTSKVTTMGCMFTACSSLTSLILSSFDTASVKNMTGMFSECASLASLDLGSFDTLNATYMTKAFDKCSSLKSVALGNRFRFKDSMLPTPPNGRVWVLSTGTDGAYYSADELASAYTGGTMQGVYIWSKGSVEDAVISGLPSSVAYSGVAYSPEVTVILNGGTLRKNTDYRSSYSNNINRGTATLTIIGINGYAGSLTKTFVITALSIADASITDVFNRTYNGSAQTQNPTVTVGGLTATRNLSYLNNVNAGTATVTITGTGNYAGTLTRTFTIAPLSIANASVTGISSRIYNGSAQTQNLSVKVGDLTATRAVSYANNVNAGTATVTITGTGNYTGSLVKTFTIAPLSIAKAVVTGIVDRAYTGKAQGQNPTVKVNGLTATRALAYKNNVNAGTATVTITGTGNYTGSIAKTFKINPAKLAASGAKLAKATLAYTGKAVKPKVSVKYGGKTLKAGADYTVTYAKNPKAVGTYKVKIVGKGNYAGTASKSYVVKPKATAVTKTRAYDARVGGGIEVSWKKVPAQVDGYEVWLSTSKKFSSSGLKKQQFAATSAVGKKASFKGQGLKKGVQYYVKIRTYKKAGGKTYYSAWSKAKGVKTKKSA